MYLCRSKKLVIYKKFIFKNLFLAFVFNIFFFGVQAASFLGPHKYIFQEGRGASLVPSPEQISELEKDYSLKICRNPDGTVQPFRLHRDPVSNSLSVVALGALVGDRVVLFNSSICALRSSDSEKDVIFPIIQGDVEIRDSYIEGGSIQSENSIPEEKRDIRTIFIENSDLKGNFFIKNKVNIVNSSLKGGPILQGNVGNGISIQNSSLDYSDIELAHGLTGFVIMDNAHLRGNHDLQSSPPETSISKGKEDLIYLVNLGSFDNPGSVGGISIKGNVSVKESNLEGNIVLAGPEINIEFSEIKNDVNMSGRFSVFKSKLYSMSFNNNPASQYLNISNSIISGIPGSTFIGVGDIRDSELEGDIQIKGEFYSSSSIFKNRLQVTNKVITFSVISEGDLVLKGGGEWGINLGNSTFRGSNHFQGSSSTNFVALEGDNKVEGDGLISNTTGSNFLINVSSFTVSDLSNQSHLNLQGEWVSIKNSTWAGSLALTGSISVMNSSLGLNVDLTGINHSDYGAASLYTVTSDDYLILNLIGQFNSCHLSNVGNNIQCTSSINP